MSAQPTSDAREVRTIHVDAPVSEERPFDRFVELAGHDLRSPLAAVYGALRALEHHTDGQLDEVSQQLLGLGITAAERLDGMLSDLLSYAHSLRAGGAIEPVDLQDTVAAAARAAPDLRIEYRRLPGVLGDPVALEHLFANLFTNAATHAGATARVRIDAWGADGRWRLAVCDDGPGIPESERTRVLEPFQNHGGSGGTGLGLSLVSRIAAEHGSRVEVGDSPLGGAGFRFSLPALLR